MPPLAIAAAGAAAQLGSGVIGAIESSNARDEAKQMALQALAQYDKLGMPPDQSAPLILQQLKSQGIYEPGLEQAINQATSKVSQIQEKPEFRNAQLQALQGLSQVSSGGLRPEDRAAFNKIRNQAAQEAQSKRAAILQNMQQRGMAGSGAELAAQLSAAQSGDQALSEAGDQISAQSSQRALEALGQLGGLSTNVRGQEFGINQARSAAEDEMNRFNISNQISQQARNIQSQNQAQLSNLQEKQRLADYNVNQSNNELMRQQQAQRQNYMDRLNLAQNKASALTGQAAQQRQDAAATGQSYANIGAGVGSALGQIAGQQERSRLMDTLGPDDQKKAALAQLYKY